MCAHLQHGPVVIQVGNALEQTPPDANVIKSNTHPSSRQRVPHVVSVTQEEHACEQQTAVCLVSYRQMVFFIFGTLVNVSAGREAHL